MGQATFIEFDGTQYEVEVANGISLMAAAVAHAVRGIDGDCGGFCACATCHVHVDPAWQAAVGPPASEAESELLQLAPGVADDSRLACQIKMSKELDGVIVRLPESQH